MKTYSVLEVRSAREAKALRLELRGYSPTSDIVAYQSKGQWLARCSDSSVPFEISQLVPLDQWIDVLYTYTYVAWPEHLFNLSRLPENSVVWGDGERRIKRGGEWCVLTSKNYFSISEETALDILPKAWQR